MAVVKLLPSPAVRHLHPVTLVERIDAVTEDLPRCIYCGWPTFPGRTACGAHADLPELDVPTILRRRLATGYPFPPDAA